MNTIEEKQYKQLKEGLLSLEIDSMDDVCKKLITYLSLLSKWNKAYNLTSITAPDKMVSQHVLDSLTINPYLKGNYFIDVGSGAGLPGIPLAILNAKKQFTLLDSLNKRTKFLQQVCYELHLENVTVVNSRVEAFHPEIKFDQVLTRAFAPLSKMLKDTKHLLVETGQFLAMKGGNFEEELEEIAQTYTIVGIHPLAIPGLQAKRHLLILEGSHSG